MMQQSDYDSDGNESPVDYSEEPTHSDYSSDEGVGGSDEEDVMDPVYVRHLPEMSGKSYNLGGDEDAPMDPIYVRHLPELGWRHVAHSVYADEPMIPTYVKYLPELSGKDVTEVRRGPEIVHLGVLPAYLDTPSKEVDEDETYLGKLGEYLGNDASVERGAPAITGHNLGALPASLVYAAEHDAGDDNDSNDEPDDADQVGHPEVATVGSDVVPTQLDKSYDQVLHDGVAQLAALIDDEVKQDVEADREAESRRKYAVNIDEDSEDDEVTEPGADEDAPTQVRVRPRTGNAKLSALIKRLMSVRRRQLAAQRDHVAFEEPLTTTEDVKVGTMIGKGMRRFRRSNETRQRTTDSMISEIHTDVIPDASGVAMVPAHGYSTTDGLVTAASDSLFSSTFSIELLPTRYTAAGRSAVATFRTALGSLDLSSGDVVKNGVIINMLSKSDAKGFKAGMYDGGINMDASLHTLIQESGIQTREVDQLSLFSFASHITRKTKGRGGYIQARLLAWLIRYSVQGPLGLWVDLMSVGVNYQGLLEPAVVTIGTDCTHHGFAVQESEEHAAAEPRTNECVILTSDPEALTTGDDAWGDLSNNGSTGVEYLTNGPLQLAALSASPQMTEIEAAIDAEGKSCRVNISTKSAQSTLVVDACLCYCATHIIGSHSICVLRVGRSHPRTTPDYALGGLYGLKLRQFDTIARGEEVAAQYQADGWLHNEASALKRVCVSTRCRDTLPHTAITLSWLMERWSLYRQIMSIDDGYVAQLRRVDRAIRERYVMPSLMVRDGAAAALDTDSVYTHNGILGPGGYGVEGERYTAAHERVDAANELAVYGILTRQNWAHGREVAGTRASELAPAIQSAFIMVWRSVIKFGSTHGDQVTDAESALEWLSRNELTAEAAMLLGENVLTYAITDIHLAAMGCSGLQRYEALQDLAERMVNDDDEIDSIRYIRNIKNALAGGLGLGGDAEIKDSLAQMLS